MLQPKKIENAYTRSSLVAQIFVYGDSFRSQLVGIAVPDPEYLQAFVKTDAGKQFANREMSDLCNDEDFKNVVLADMNKVAKECKLRGFERVAAIHLEPEMWVPGGLLTPSFKLKRAEARKVYQNEIDQLYSGLESVAGKSDIRQE
eukprot:gb/GECG01013430.1/.p1 GENE.gb/GECG01013430.1/~~gb/GECG01013430.1/.p1  ORF type:complete len:146 (+),score=21.32 gb/GECG01013430.1/:1-438(+)